MKNILIISVLLLSTAVLAQLPSWGMTEQQYKMPNSGTKLTEIGQQAAKNKWQLKVIAPQAWHESIRSGLSNEGKKNVMMTFKDSLHNSISISASKAKNMGQNISSGDDVALVQKQVVIEDKPEIDTTVERPEFNDEFMNGKTVVADVDLDLELPKPQTKVVVKTTPEPVEQTVVKPEAKPVVEADTKPVTTPVTTPVAKQAEPEVAEEGEVTQLDNDDDLVQSAKSHLRKRYAKNKNTSGILEYDNITKDDELFMTEGVVLIERKNNSRSFYYWMKEAYDSNLHAFEKKSNERYVKTVDAKPTAHIEKNDSKVSVSEKIDRTSLVFTAVDDQTHDQDELRRDYTRNKMVTKSYGADKLKSGDLIYTYNNTALVVRRLSRTNEIYFWLKGEVNITEDIVMMDPNEFKMK